MDKGRQLELVLKALANRRRLTIVKYLAGKPKASVGDIAETIKLSFKSTSRHLAVLYGADILGREQTSTSVFYSLSQPLHPAVKVALHIL